MNSLEKNNIPAGYKESAVGIIPQEWEVKRIQEICKVDAKSLSAKTSPDYEFEYISLSDVDSDSFDISTSHQIFQTAPSRARRIVSKGDVVISTVRPNLRGFFLAKENKKDLIASTGFAVLTPTECDSQYLLSCFFSQIVSKQFYSLVVGSNYPAVNSSDVAKLKLAVPPLAEQRKIAEILGVWDEAIEKQSRLIEKLELRKRGLMQRLLTSRTRLPGFIDDVQYKKLKPFIVEKSERNTNQTYTNVLSVTNNRGFINQAEQFDREVASDNTANYKLVHRGQFAYNPSRVNVGSLDLLQTYDLGILSPMYIVFETRPTMDPKFLYYQLKSGWFVGHIPMYVQGSVRDSLSFDGLENMKFWIPSLPEQKAIAEVHTTADKEIATPAKSWTPCASKSEA